MVLYIFALVVTASLLVAPLRAGCRGSALLDPVEEAVGTHGINDGGNS
jgi:hypothetical protein